MRGRGARRDFTSREARLIDSFIDDICDQLGLNTRDISTARYYRNLGWEGFLEVYRSQPESFRAGGFRGWNSAALVIREKLWEEKQARDFALYGQISLDAPVSEEQEVPLMELLVFRQGDHQNSVCFWDYLERLGERNQDAAFLARRLIDRETMEEIRDVYDWPPDRLYQAFNSLRAAMEEYLRI